MKIFKYQVGVQEVAEIEMPLGAKIIRVDGLDGKLWVWAIINEAENWPKEKRIFHLFKTGAEMPEDILDNYEYCGCGAIFVQQELMMYFFEKKGEFAEFLPTYRETVYSPKPAIQ